MRKFLFTTLAVGALAVTAHAVSANYAPGTGENNSKCYWIYDRADLDAFADMVGNDQDLAFNNGSFNKTFTPSTACAKLKADIDYSGDITVVTKGSSWGQTTYSANKNARTWKPIMFFGGSFDGEGHTIKGLYAEQDWEPAFIRKAVGGLVVKNLTIDDAFFKTSNMGAGGIVGDVAYTTNGFNSKPVLINDCAVTNSYLSSGKQNTGGFVGGVGDGMSLTMTNSYVSNTYVNNPATRNCDGSAKKDNFVFVGYVNPNTRIDLLNCAYYSTQSNICAYNTKTTDGVENVVKGNNEQGCINAINEYKNQNANSAKLLASMDAEDLKEKEGIEGLEFDLEQGENGTAKVRVTVGVLSESEGILTIGKDIQVDAVTFDREFQEGVNSTVMLPFSIAANAVEGAKFFNITSISYDGTKWDAAGDQEVSLIVAHTPYLVKPTASKLTFKGGVTLKATDGSMNEVAIDGADNWSFRGVYKTTTWLEGDPDLGTVGQIYGYSSKAVEDKEIAAGAFVKGGKNVRVKSMRAYLYYAMPCASALCKSAPVELPSSIEVHLTEHELPPYVEKVVESIEPSVEDEQEDAPLSIVKPMIAPEAVKANRWYDLNGRRLNKKPTNHGSFYNKPVIIK